MVKMKKYILTQAGELILVAGEAKDFRMPSIEIIYLDTGDVDKIWLDDLEEDINTLTHVPWQ